MHQSQFRVILLLVLLSGIVQIMPFSEIYAETNVANEDTTKTYHYAPVTVTASRIYSDTHKASSSHSTMSREDINRLNARSLAEVLNASVGVFIKDYGGFSGLKTISQRGLGAEHTLILLNGFRLTGFQNGLVDLGIFSADDIENVEVIRGGHSSEYGADAVSGIVNIVTALPSSSSSLRASSSVGSFGYRQYRAIGSFQIDSFVFSASYAEEKSNEDFTFGYSNGNIASEILRGNADVYSRSGLLRNELHLGTYNITTLFRSYTSERGVGGPVVSPITVSHSRQTDNEHVGQLIVQNQMTPSTSVFLGGQIHYAYERFVDPDVVIANTSIDTYFKYIDTRLNSHVSFQSSEAMKWNIGGEIARTQSGGNSVRDDPSRSQYGMFITGEQSLVFSASPISSVIVSPALRYDASSASISVVSPQVGVAVNFLPWSLGDAEQITTTVRGSVSRNYRLPTFNELYYNGGGGLGNPFLKPEMSINVDLGGALTWHAFVDHAVNGSYFLIEMNDRILWVASGGSIVIPKNISHVRSTGIELQYSMTTMNRLLSIQVQYAGTRAVKTDEDYRGDPTVGKQLLYIPQETFAAFMTLTKTFGESLVARADASLQYHEVGFRYYTQDNTGFLPSYRIVNGNISTRLHFAPVFVDIKFEVNNLFNESYQVIVAYPMPLRSYRLSVSVEY